MDLLLDFFIVAFDQFFISVEVRNIKVRLVDVDPCVINIDGANGESGGWSDTFGGAVSTSSVAIWAFIFWTVVFDVSVEVTEVALVFMVFLVLLNHGVPFSIDEMWRLSIPEGVDPWWRWWWCAESTRVDRCRSFDGVY
jgi:hypothetical protein